MLVVCVSAQVYDAGYLLEVFGLMNHEQIKTLEDDESDKCCECQIYETK